MAELNELSRSPGRPPQSMQVRDDLIHHARLLFIAHPYEKVSLRMVANAAGVNMAMIRYYFNNKAGLFETMLRDTVSPMQQVIQEADTGEGSNLFLVLMTKFYDEMSKHKNFPVLMSRTMKLSRDLPQRQILEKIMLEHVPIMQEKLKGELNREGVLQEGVSAQLGFFSFLNLMVFPFIAPPEMLKLHGITVDDEFILNLLKHNIRLLKQGIIT